MSHVEQVHISLMPTFFAVTPNFH
ncbi:hypothetical protein [Vibrio coralliilyticus]